MSGFFDDRVDLPMEVAINRGFNVYTASQEGRVKFLNFSQTVIHVVVKYTPILAHLGWSIAMVDSCISTIECVGS